MTAQDFFYAAAGIAFALLSLLLILAIYLAVRIEKAVRTSLHRMNAAAYGITDYLEGVARAWGRLTIARIVIKTFRSIFGRR